MIATRCQARGASVHGLQEGWARGAVGGIYDDKGRIMVAISLNSDLGDSWEWSDETRYPEKYASMGLKIGVNYVVYAMTH